MRKFVLPALVILYLLGMSILVYKGVMWLYHKLKPKATQIVLLEWRYGKNYSTPDSRAGEDQYDEY